jgi:hypothetical protein
MDADSPDQAEQDEALGTPTEVAIATYAVTTPSREVIVEDVADISVNERGELYLHDAEAGLLAVFAQGQWLRIVAMSVETDQGEA